MSRAWCRWCGAEIRWAKTTNDKNIPLDPCPTLDGRWRISLGRPLRVRRRQGTSPDHGRTTVRGAHGNLHT